MRYKCESGISLDCICLHLFYVAMAFSYIAALRARLEDMLVKRCAELRNRRPAGSSNWMLVSRSRMCVWIWFPRSIKIFEELARTSMPNKVFSSTNSFCYSIYPSRTARSSRRSTRGRSSESLLGSLMIAGISSRVLANFYVDELALETLGSQCELTCLTVS
jgi:hypothetical protein